MPSAPVKKRGRRRLVRPAGHPSIDDFYPPTGRPAGKKRWRVRVLMNIEGAGGPGKTAGGRPVGSSAGSRSAGPGTSGCRYGSGCLVCDKLLPGLHWGGKVGAGSAGEIGSGRTTGLDSDDSKQRGAAATGYGEVSMDSHFMCAG